MVATAARLRRSPSPQDRWYEEYHPYGTTAWQAPELTTVSLKRYKYTGMERDEETGLQRHGVRYYAAWLGRWTSADPIGLGDGVNRYGYCHGGPITGSDSTGLVTQVLIGGAYVKDGETHTWGHAALRVYGEGYDKTYDFGRYGATGGRFSSQGEGILNVYEDFGRFREEQNYLGRETTGFTFDSTSQQDAAVMQFFEAKISAAEPRESLSWSGAAATYKLAENYDARSFNCTTVTADAFGAGLPGILLDQPAYNVGQGLSSAEKAATSLAGWPDRVFMPADLKTELEAEASKGSEILVETWSAQKGHALLNDVVFESEPGQAGECDPADPIWDPIWETEANIQSVQ